MFSLFHDQSLGKGVFALFQDGHEIEVFSCELVESRHPCLLLDLLLRRHGLGIKDISFLICGIGPGSYTGIRSAAATIKAISLATQKPIVALSSLLLFTPTDDGSYCIAVDGGVGGVFVQKVCVSTEYCLALPPERLEIDTFIERANLEENIIVNSKEWVQRRICALTQFPLDKLREGCINVRMIAKMAYQEFEIGRCHDASSLPQLYLRKTQAEIERESAS